MAAQQPLVGLRVQPPYQAPEFPFVHDALELERARATANQTPGDSPWPS